jgi:hypothetical protein
MTITWKIESVFVNPKVGNLSEVVISANWRVFVESKAENLKGTSHGRVTFSMPSNDFIPFADLTEKIVLGWVWEQGYTEDPDIGPWSKQIAEAQAIKAVEAQRITERQLPS